MVGCHAFGCPFGSSDPSLLAHSGVYGCRKAPCLLCIHAFVVELIPEPQTQSLCYQPQLESFFLVLALLLPHLERAGASHLSALRLTQGVMLTPAEASSCLREAASLALEEMPSME